MGTYAPYSEYKGSGHDWLGEIPLHWKQKRFKFLFQASNEKNGNNIVGEMLSVSGYRGIEVKEYEDEKHKRTEDELTEYRVVRPGQLVVNTMWLNYAGLGVSEYEGYVSPAYRSYWLDSSLHGRFAHHLLRSSNYVMGYTKYMQGIRPNSLQIKTDDFQSFPIIVPPESEQAQIANFLDYETTKIDQLIAKQELLIDLLKEKRQAAISYAIIKGLNPDAPMKDSGMKWLGEVPAHWKSKALKHFIGHTIDNRGRTPPLSDDGIPMLEAKQIVGDSLFASENFDKFVTQDAYNQFVRSDIKENDVLFVTVGSIGKACLAPPDPKFFIAQNIVGFRHNRTSDPFFLMFLFRSDAFKQALAATNKLSILDSTKVSDLVRVGVTAPPLEEQVAIGRYLQDSEHKFSQLASKLNSAKQLLTEHRTALISSAVTGKIDVRGWQKPDTEPEETAPAVSA